MKTGEWEAYLRLLARGYAWGEFILEVSHIQNLPKPLNARKVLVEIWKSENPKQEDGRNHE